MRDRPRSPHRDRPLVGVQTAHRLPRLGVCCPPDAARPRLTRASRGVCQVPAKPFFVAPVLPVRLRDHPVTEEHLTKLTSRGISVVPTARRDTFLIRQLPNKATRHLGRAHRQARPLPTRRPPAASFTSPLAVVVLSVPSSSVGSSTASFNSPSCCCGHPRCCCAQRAELVGGLLHRIGPDGRAARPRRPDPRRGQA